MEIVIDIGNSAIKIGHIDSAGKVSNVARRSAANFDPNADLDLPAGSVAIIGRSGSHDNLTAILDHLKKKNVSTHLLEKTVSLPFASHYAPGQAGIDRLANVTAAIAIAPGPSIIIDAGSAITFEVISLHHNFIGGAILPGIRLQAQSLNNSTADLPDIYQSDAVPSPISIDTASAIRSGIIHGIAGALQHISSLAATHFGGPVPRRILTGGDANILSQALPCNDFTVIPELTLQGLYLLAKYQDNQ